MWSSAWSRRVVLVAQPAALGLARVLGVGGHGEDRRQVESLAFQCAIPCGGVEHLDAADRLVDAAEAELGQVSPDVLGDEPEVVLHELGLAVEPRPQFGVLGGDADRAGVEMADPHHDAAGHHQRCGGEAEFLGAEQHRDDHVASGAHAAVALHGDPVSQPVEHEGLLGVGQADLPTVRLHV